MFEYTPPPIVCEHVIPHKMTEECSWSFPLRQMAQTQLDTLSDEELDDNWKLHEFFETIAVINLPQAHERLQKITQELYDIGTTTFEVFQGVDGRKEVDPSIWNKFYLNLHNIDTSTEEGKHAMDLLHQGQAGCYLSHYQLIKKVKAAFESAQNEWISAKARHDAEAIGRAERDLRKYGRVLIFEDDGCFGFLQDDSCISRQGAGKVLREAFRELPDDWDMLYFVVHASEPTEEISPRLRKLGRTWALTAYAINYSMYGPLIELLKKIEDPAVTHVWPVDNEIAEIQHLHNVYAIYPSVVYTAAGFSYITGKTWDLWQEQPIYQKYRNKKRNTP
ncbi:MAG: glycosyltransferase family 25 protein [Parachlamydia sp.]|nr:glycosyltransferase family 25 protein [Parachlamydia sp.]